MERRHRHAGCWCTCPRSTSVTTTTWNRRESARRGEECSSGVFIAIRLSGRSDADHPCPRFHGFIGREPARTSSNGAMSTNKCPARLSKCPMFCLRFVFADHEMLHLAVSYVQITYRQLSLADSRVWVREHHATQTPAQLTHNSERKCGCWWVVSVGRYTLSPLRLRSPPNGLVCGGQAQAFETRNFNR
jgi:hypothetical protein